MHASKTIRNVLLVLLILPFSQVAAQTTARIAGWNLLGFYPTPDSRIPALARGIVTIDADLVAVVEVNPIHTLSRMVNELADQGHPYLYKIISQPARQKIGILHKPNVEVAEVQLIPGSDLGNPDMRKALFCRVRVNKFDFYLVAVHLKSSRSAADRALRNEQAEAIARFLRRKLARGSERDVLIVGDYNMIPPDDDGENDQENFETLGTQGYIRFISSKELVGQASHINNKGELSNLLDGYGISKDHTTEYVPDSLEILPLHKRFNMSLLNFSRQVSDHLPLVASFEADHDDDPDRFDWGPFAAWSQRSSVLAEPPASAADAVQYLELQPTRSSSQLQCRPHRCRLGWRIRQRCR